MLRKIDWSNTAVMRRLDQAIRFFLYVLFFWLPYSPAVIETCVSSALFLWLIKRAFLLKDLSDRGEFKNKWQRLGHAFSPTSSFLNWAIAFFFFVCVFSVSGSLFLKQSIYGFVAKTLEWFIVYFLILEVFTERRHIFIVFSIFIFSALATVLDGLVQFYWTKKDIFNGFVLTSRGATASFKHPNQLAGFLTFISSISFSLLFRQGASKRFRLFFFLFFILTIWSLILTFSRAGWFANICGILLCLYLVNKKLFKKIFLSGLLILILVYLVLPLDVKQKFRLDPTVVSQTARWRFQVWTDSLKMVKEAPFFGHGLNTYMRLFQYYRRNPVDFVQADPTYAHNCFIQLTAETGILGLTGFLWILGGLFRHIIRKFESAAEARRAEDSFFLSVLIGLLGGIAGFLVHSFFDINLYSLKLSILFWCMVGLCVSVDRLIIINDQRMRKSA